MGVFINNKQGKNKKEDDGTTPGPGNYNSSLGNRGLSGTKYFFFNKDSATLKE